MKRKIPKDVTFPIRCAIEVSLPDGGIIEGVKGWLPSGAKTVYLKKPLKCEPGETYSLEWDPVTEKVRTRRIRRNP